MQKQKSKTARQKYQTNEGYLGYRDLIWVGSPPSMSCQVFDPSSRSDCVFRPFLRAYRRT